jgi:hypothetical protein
MEVSVLPNPNPSGCMCGRDLHACYKPSEKSSLVLQDVHVELKIKKTKYDGRRAFPHSLLPTFVCIATT